MFKFGSLFDSLNQPQLSLTSQPSLESPFSVAEIAETIKSLPSGKCPGLDGFGADFYQAFHHILTPLLLRMINDSVINKILPPSLYEANICVVLKKGKDTGDPSNYRPISLLNLDHKIFTKVLASRLNKHIETIIHSDQVGFIPGRHSFSNVRHLMNILCSVKSDYINGAVLTLDAQKAFDSIEWPYLFEAMRRFGFGETFVNWIKMIYHSPKSSVITNNMASESFSLHGGVR